MRHAVVSPDEERGSASLEEQLRRIEELFASCNLLARTGWVVRDPVRDEDTVDSSSDRIQERLIRVRSRVARLRENAELGCRLVIHSAGRSLVDDLYSIAHYRSLAMDESIDTRLRAEAFFRLRPLHRGRVHFEGLEPYWIRIMMSSSDPEVHFRMISAAEAFRPSEFVASTVQQFLHASHNDTVKITCLQMLGSVVEDFPHVLESIRSLLLDPSEEVRERAKEYVDKFRR